MRLFCQPIAVSYGCDKYRSSIRHSNVTLNIYAVPISVNNGKDAGLHSLGADIQPLIIFLLLSL